VVIDLIVYKTDDGYTATIPSYNGIDCWAHKHDDALDEAVNMLCFYLNFEDKKKIKIDLSKKGKNKTVYKLIFDKD
jgi:hypothetical protein